MDLRNMKSNVTLNTKKESDEEKESDDDDDDDFKSKMQVVGFESDNEDNMQDDNNQDNDIPDENNEVNKIEFEAFNDAQPKLSTLMILEMCRNIKDKIMFPLLSNFLCIVAPLKILEALKTSHIYWPANFYKNITDLHMLRILLDYNKVSTNQPLCSPQRDESIELMLKTRVKEAEIIRGIPGAHINLNMTNEDFLDSEDNLFVQRRVPHDDLHKLVKYGDLPIYQGLKEDQSKAWIKQSLFEKLDYQTKLNCVREEAMVIALERYLIPMISNNQETSYNLALARICTTLTKGWFRQFAIDNYPRLSNLDKNLLSIAHDVIEKFPIKQKKPVVFVPDPETLAIFETIRRYTEKISSFEDLYDFSCESKFSRTGIKITSPVKSDISITVIITTLNTYHYDCHPYTKWSASVVILPSKDLEILSGKNGKDKDNLNRHAIISQEFTDPLSIHPYYGHVRNQKEKFFNLTSKHIFALEIEENHNNDSWGMLEGVGEDMMCIKAKSADHAASLLEIPDFTGDLLFKYVLYYLNPTLKDNGETPLKQWVNKLKAKGDIPIEPNQHLWYQAWNYKLNRKSNH
ncbi:hypothetical protein RclHR1_11510006 [Rhizophagus clarus]|uniref:Uncharacterized protein n=1 Tax=Rhizophagus clarus TaxID=94130 RepID=A0A2Z6Q8X0_9GLOM|nr:hypothetical protein RclHR1_11510006 [Rhizophagus clarus]GES83993.1 hypothetical protein GLOIN_2v1798535 [Rhizophagus clarus]